MNNSINATFEYTLKPATKLNPIPNLDPANENPTELNLKVSSLSKEDLINGFGKLVQTERKITKSVLEYIVEIDRRKLYLEKAYPSLFEFLVKAYGYSPPSAMRRIESARLLRELPEISEKIKSGAINLSQMAKVQQTIRTVEKTSNLKVGTEQKKELLSRIEFETQAKTELILAQEFNLPHINFEKEKIHKDESITLTMTFTKEQMVILEKAQSLVSHAVPSHKWSEVFTYLAKKEIKRKSPKAEEKRHAKNEGKQTKVLPSKELISVSREAITRRHEASTGRYRVIIKSHEASIESHEASCTGNATLSKEIRMPDFSKNISLKTRRIMLDPYTTSCQFKEPTTNRICGSHKFLQVDHIQPRWAGGSNSSGNLQVLCAQHNQYRYKVQAGLLP